MAVWQVTDKSETNEWLYDKWLIRVKQMNGYVTSEW